MNYPRLLKRRKLETKANSTIYAREQNALFRTFSETLWICILKFLNEYPNSSLAVANASLVLHDLQQNYNILNSHLPLLIWPIFFNNILHKTDFEKNQKFYRSVIVKCCSVCKNWCSKIDNFFSTHTGYYPNSDKHFQLHPDKSLSDWPAILRALILRTDWVCMSIKNFLQHFEHTHEQTERSPFVSGFIELQYTGERYRDQVQDGVIENYSRSIFHCSLEIPVATEGAYDKFEQHITQMPNLKSLHIGTVTPVRQHVRELALPTLQNLKHLVIGNVFDHDFVIALLQKNSNMLTHLEFLWDARMFGPLSKIVFTKLEHFKIDITEPSSVTLLDLARSAHTVDIDFCISLGWSPSYVVQILEEKLDEKCKTLIISLRTGKMLAESQCERLHLSSVPRLKLTLTSYMPIDFVLGMKNTLEILHVVFPERIFNEDGPYWISWINFEVWKSKPLGASILRKEEIKCLSCLENMKRSNIWDMLPKLKILRISRWGGSKVEHWEKNEGGVVKRVWLE